MEYKELTLEMLQEFILDLDNHNKERKIQFICNKQGVIDTEVALYRAIGLDEATITDRIKRLEETTEEGLYFYDGMTFNKFDYGI